MLVSVGKNLDFPYNETKLTSRYRGAVDFICILAFFLLCCCSNSEISATTDNVIHCTFSDCYVRTIYSQAGIGDFGFQDNIYYGFQTAANDLNFTLENIHPASLDSAEKSMEEFFQDSSTTPYRKRLLVLAAGEYTELLQKHPEWHQDSLNQILVLDDYNDSLDAHFRDVSLYGASYLAGAAVKQMGFQFPVILAANPKLKSVKRSVDGFDDGYSDSLETLKSDLGLVYLGEESYEGFDEDSAYRQALYFNLSIYDFVFPVIGGSNGAFFRMTRELGDDVQYKTCGMDHDQQYLSKFIAFSIVKRMDLVVEDFMAEWSSDSISEQKNIATLDSKYIYIVVSDGYSDWEKPFDNLFAKAIEEESRYLEAE